MLLGNGADVHSMLQNQLQRTCAEVIAKRLTTEKGLSWLNLLIGEWNWFESQIASIKLLPFLRYFSQAAEPARVSLYLAR